MELVKTLTWYYIHVFQVLVFIITLIMVVIISIIIINSKQESENHGSHWRPSKVIYTINTSFLFSTVFYLPLFLFLSISFLYPSGPFFFIPQNLGLLVGWPIVPVLHWTECSGTRGFQHQNWESLMQAEMSWWPWYCYLQSVSQHCRGGWKKPQGRVSYVPDQEAQAL